MITSDILRKMMDHANLKQKCILGLYAYSLRPSLIPRILIEDIRKEDIAFNPDGSITLVPKTWIIVKKEYDGNKANIDFPIILHAELRDWIERRLNARIRDGERITAKTQLIDITESGVEYVIGTLKEKVGSKGRSYLLRHYGNKRMKQSVDDYDFKEWLMGHSGKISAICDHEHYLTDEEIKEYKAQFDESAFRIYGVTEDEMRLAEQRARATQMIANVSEEKLQEILQLLNTGKMTVQEFDNQLKALAQMQIDKQIESKFEHLWIKMNNKHGNDKKS